MKHFMISELPVVDTVYANHENKVNTVEIENSAATIKLRNRLRYILKILNPHYSSVSFFKPNSMFKVKQITQEQTIKIS